MRRRGLKATSFLNLAPMIDVLTVLLIFLILTFVVDQQNQEVAESLSLPETESVAKNFPSLKLVITDQGMSLNQNQFKTMEAFSEFLRTQKQEVRPILITVDQRLSYDRVEQALKIMTASGFTEFHFLAEQKEENRQ